MFVQMRAIRLAMSLQSTKSTAIKISTLLFLVNFVLYPSSFGAFPLAFLSLSASCSIEVVSFVSSNCSSGASLPFSFLLPLKQNEGHIERKPQVPSVSCPSSHHRVIIFQRSRREKGQGWGTFCSRVRQEEPVKRSPEPCGLEKSPSAVSCWDSTVHSAIASKLLRLESFVSLLVYCNRGQGWF